MLNGVWSSSIYNNVYGTMDVIVPDLIGIPYNEQFEFKIMVKYSDCSPFRRNETKVFSLVGIRNDNRIIASTLLSFDQQFSITIVFETSVYNTLRIIGYYSGLCPVDCGTIRINDKATWSQAFNIY